MGFLVWTRVRIPAAPPKTIKRGAIYKLSAPFFMGNASKVWMHSFETVNHPYSLLILDWGKNYLTLIIIRGKIIEKPCTIVNLLRCCALV